MRGEELPYDCFVVIPGITPACAGRRLCNASAVRLVEDHPRVCGEKSTVRCAGLHPRITPACAGRRKIVADYLELGRDHPRVCGEKSPIISAKSHTKGSPPRVRGEESRSMPRSSTIRITPACAGRSFSSTTLNLMGRDHPRVCGEKTESLFVRSTL